MRFSSSEPEICVWVVQFITCSTARVVELNKLSDQFLENLIYHQPN